MFKNFLTVRRFGYLKRPVYKWTLENTGGGAFSNSGEYRDLKGCFTAFFAMNPTINRDETPVTIYNIDADGAETITAKMQLSEVKL